MTDFLVVMKHIVRVEGGNVDDPLDRGGRTRNGVTQQTYDRYRLGHGEPLLDVWEMPDAERNDLYLHEFWLAGRCDLIAEATERLALCHMDACVHHGVRAVKRDGRVVGANVMLQELIGVKRDGWIGPATLSAVRQMLTETDGDNALVSGYLALREARFRRIVAADPSQGRFLKGWLSRLEILRDDVEKLA